MEENLARQGWLLPHTGGYVHRCPVLFEQHNSHGIVLDQLLGDAFELDLQVIAVRVREHNLRQALFELILGHFRRLLKHLGLHQWRTFVEHLSRNLHQHPARLVVGPTQNSNLRLVHRLMFHQRGLLHTLRLLR